MMSVETLAEPSGSTRIVCEHCGLPAPDSRSDSGDGFWFCCSGCEVAYETIRGCGLEDYYAMRDRFASGRQSAMGAGGRYASYDSEAFHTRHVSSTSGGLRSIEFRLEGVHCAACVWLVEKLPKVAPGVLDARLSLGTSRARVCWNPEQATLSTVAATLDRLGYAPHPARDVSAHAARDSHDRRRLVNLAMAGALAGNNMLIAVALYAGVFEGIEPQYARLFRWLSMAIGWLSLAGPGATFFRSAWSAVRARVANLDLPISVALAVGALSGTANVLLDRSEVYFDSLSVLVFLLLVGRYLQSRQQRWAEDAVGQMLAMTPDSCRVVRDGQLVDESIEALAVGDEVEVRPGELFPVDGEVAAGESAIDQSLLTGESLPTPVAIGDIVSAGAQNISATLRVRAAAVGEATRIGKLSRLVEDGLAAKPPIVQLTDKIAGRFLAVVLAIAAANFAWWASTQGVAQAVDASVALLIVACPCALGLATPLTMAVGLGLASKQGMLVKSAAALERLAAVRPGNPGRLHLDKTGTLTNGKLQVVSWTGDKTVKRWVAAVEAESNHPIARALNAAIGEQDPADDGRLTNRREQHGCGVRANTPIGDLVVGSTRYAEGAGCRIEGEFAESVTQGREGGYTIVVAAVDGVAAGVAWLRDDLHPGSHECVGRLARGGWECEIVSGDEPNSVQRVAKLVGIEPESHAHGGVAPEEKFARIEVAARTPNLATVVMVGDGVNDAAALAAADVGVAVHGGAEASLAAADVYLSDPGIASLEGLVALSRRTMRVVRRNLAISLAYNSVAIALAVCGWVTPLTAAVLMPASSATVLASAVSLGREPTRNVEDGESCRSYS